MKSIQPTVKIVREDWGRIQRRLDRYGRTCYKADVAASDMSVGAFLRKRIDDGHESVIEHESITVIFEIDRGVTHEVVRHRIAAYSQESTRYCNYAKDKFGAEITVIDPFFFKNPSRDNWIQLYQIWYDAMEYAEKKYMELLSLGAKAQEARSVLPQSTKAEIVVTYNIREWRHFFSLRAHSAAHPQMQQVAIPLLIQFRKLMPILFEDIKENLGFNPNDYASVEIIDID
jgi:thymidylate synthase (FAD)